MSYLSYCIPVKVVLEELREKICQDFSLSKDGYYGEKIYLYCKSKEELVSFLDVIRNAIIPKSMVVDYIDEDTFTSYCNNEFRGLARRTAIDFYPSVGASDILIAKVKIEGRLKKGWNILPCTPLLSGVAGIEIYVNHINIFLTGYILRKVTYHELVPISR